MWLVSAVKQRLQEEFVKLDVEINQEKTKIVNLEKGESFSFLGFDFYQRKNWKGKKTVAYTPTRKAKTALMLKIKETFKKSRSQPLKGVIDQINPILRGWTNYFRIGNSSRCFEYIRHWVEKKIRRHRMKKIYSLSRPLSLQLFIWKIGMCVSRKLLSLMSQSRSKTNHYLYESYISPYIYSLYAFLFSLLNSINSHHLIAV